MVSFLLRLFYSTISRLLLDKLPNFNHHGHVMNYNKDYFVPLELEGAKLPLYKVAV